MSWWIISVKVPSEPSRHRVAAWRELRRAAAVSLSNGAWAMPDGDDAATVRHRLAEIVDNAGGEIYAFETQPDAQTLERLKSIHVQAREAEWVEFLDDCGKFETEIAREFSKEKFTLGELEEEEQSLDRLRRWYRDLRAKSVFGAPSADAATGRLADATAELERYANEVYARRDSAAEDGL
jgi:hypothetical protein